MLVKLSSAGAMEIAYAPNGAPAVCGRTAIEMLSARRSRDNRIGFIAQPGNQPPSLAGLTFTPGPIVEATVQERIY